MDSYKHICQNWTNKCRRMSTADGMTILESCQCNLYNCLHQELDHVTIIIICKTTYQVNALLATEQYHSYAHCKNPKMSSELQSGFIQGSGDP